MSETETWSWWVSNSWRRLMASDGRGRDRAVLMPVVHRDGQPDIVVQPDDAALIAAAPKLRAALRDITDRYAALIKSGDCGNWNPEGEDFVKAARAALAACDDRKALL